MHCPVCGGVPSLVEIRELEGRSEAYRKCGSCKLHWIFIHRESTLYAVRDGTTSDENHGFRCFCSSCGTGVSYFTSLRPAWWKCQTCESKVPREGVNPIGSYVIPDAPIKLVFASTHSFSMTKKFRSGGLKAISHLTRTHRPTPEGSVSLAMLAQELNIEPKKLRSWLRKVKWRPTEEAKSQWLFSREEANEVASHLGVKLSGGVKNGDGGNIHDKTGNMESGGEGHGESG